MRIIGIIASIILFLGVSNSLKGNIPSFYIKDQLEQNGIEKSKRIERITEYKFNEELNWWYPSKITIFQYGKANFLEAIITYSDYLIVSKKYKTRVEKRNSKGLKTITDIKPIEDADFKNWSKEKGTIFLTNKKENQIEDYQFRFSPEINKWFLSSMMTDKFENDLKVERYNYSDVDPGNFPIQESKETYEYLDTLLVKKLSMSRKGQDNEWNFSRKETYEFQGNRIKKKLLFFYSESENKWNLSRSEEYTYEQEMTTKVFLEYNIQNNTKSGQKIIEKRNSFNIVQENIHLNWNNAKNEFEHFYTETYLYEDDLKLQEIQSYTQSGYYDKYMTLNTFDALNRLIKTEKKNKNDEDEKWKYLNGTTFTYDQENKVPSSLQKINSKGKVTEEINIVFDDFKNPIKRISTMNGRKREIEIKHDYSLNSDCILNSDELKIFETNIDKGIWIHKNVPIERIYYRVKNGEKIGYKKIEYVFGEVK